MVMMIRSLSLFAASSFLVSVAVATPQLDAITFAELTGSGKNGMIKFYQPWCGHCTSMKPAWDEVSESADKSVFIADVNCSEQDELCSQVGVQGYPTIKVYKDGEVTDYKGGRSVEDLSEYVDTQLATKCDITKLEETCSTKAVPYAAKWKDKDTASIQKEISRLSGMANKSMTAELKGWLRERLHILNQYAPAVAGSGEEEL